VARASEELTDTQGTVDIDRDRVLVLRCQAGDATAFAELYTRYYERLLRFCRRRLGDAVEAEDMAQEAFVKAWRALPRFAGERRFYPWLTVIAGNLCTDVLRKRSRTVMDGDGDLDMRRAALADDDISPEEQVVAAADGEVAQKALQRLTVRHQRVLALREGSELTYQQIAAREGVDVSAVETLLWRARQALKREFAALSGTGSASAVFGCGVITALRRAAVRTGHGAAVAVRRLAAFRFGGVPVREAAVALVVTSAAVTAGAQFLHGPPRAASATPALRSSGAPDLRAAHAGAVGAALSHGAASGAGAPVEPLLGLPASSGSGGAPSGPAGAATPAGSPAASVPGAPVGGPAPSFPALPHALPQPGVPSTDGTSGLSGVVGIVTSTLPSSPATGAAGSATSGVTSTVAGATGAVSQTLSSTGGTLGVIGGAVPSLSSPLGGLSLPGSGAAG
jgi:RNA polymerase sigma-70 factor (ECF subfamily)